jgi:hypothetical protein
VGSAAGEGYGVESVCVAWTDDGGRQVRFAPSLDSSKRAGCNEAALQARQWMAGEVLAWLGQGGAAAVDSW